MSLQSLLAYLRDTPLDGVDPTETRLLVRSLLNDLPQPVPPDLLELAHRLERVEDAMSTGGDATEDLAALLSSFDAPQAVSPGEQLEQWVRQVAAGLSRDEWYTETYASVESAVAEYREGNRELLERVLQEVASRLEGAWEPYYHAPVAADEVTAETVVGHRILLEGVQGWFDALEALRLAAAGEVSWDDALAQAEAANRLLVAVPRLARQVELEAGPDGI